MTEAPRRKPIYPVNKYLEGNYAPIREELVVEFEDMTVIGEMPTDLDGVYVRNGPNNQHQPLGKYHRYDGDGMLHGVHFKDGRATYRNKWIQTSCFAEETAAGEALWGGMLDQRIMELRPSEYMMLQPLRTLPTMSWALRGFSVARPGRVAQNMPRH